MADAVQGAFNFALRIVSEARGFGYETYPDGAQVFGRVPHVAPLAWLHKLYPPLQERQLATLQTRLGRPIPDIYRYWLALSNGLNVFSEGLVLDGLRTDYSRGRAVVQPYDLDLANVLSRLKDVSREAFFIGSLLEAEYLLYLVPSTGIVHACGRTSAVSLAMWESLPTLIVSVMTSFKPAFDSAGRPLRRLTLQELARGVLN